MAKRSLASSTALLPTTLYKHQTYFHNWSTFSSQVQFPGTFRYCDWFPGHVYLSMLAKANYGLMTTDWPLNKSNFHNIKPNSSCRRDLYLEENCCPGHWPLWFTLINNIFNSTNKPWAESENLLERDFGRCRGIMASSGNIWLMEDANLEKIETCGKFDLFPRK